MSLVVTSRRQLGDLWTPWCVERDDPSVPVQLADHPERGNELRQLRVSDLDDSRAREALRVQRHPDGRRSLDKIEGFATTLRPPFDF
jgi:hypothetical protein